MLGADNQASIFDLLGRQQVFAHSYSPGESESDGWGDCRAYLLYMHNGTRRKSMLTKRAVDCMSVTKEIFFETIISGFHIFKQFKF